MRISGNKKKEGNIKLKKHLNELISIVYRTRRIRIWINILKLQIEDPIQKINKFFYFYLDYYLSEV